VFAVSGTYDTEITMIECEDFADVESFCQRDESHIHEVEACPGVLMQQFCGAFEVL
jgi:hypothetical protein